MSDKFKELFEEARNSGVDSEWVDRFESTFEASGLRKDNVAIKERFQAAAEENKTLKSGLLKTRFSELGIKLNPDILSIPDTLNPADADNVKTWAVQSGLIEDTPTTPPAERETHDRIAAASNEGSAKPIPSASDLANMSEEEFWRQAPAREAALKSKL